MRTIAIAVTLAGALALSACKKDPPDDLPPPPQDTVDTTPTPTGPLGPEGAVPGTQQHFVEVMQGADTIYFDTDKFDLGSEDIAALRSQAAYLQQYPTVRATIEGHCDERGTRDYNIALGDRRANAAKNYLVSLGVAGDRLTAVSYGKERPVALGSNEEAWARNRRAVTVVLN